MVEVCGTETRDVFDLILVLKWQKVVSEEENIQIQNSKYILADLNLLCNEIGSVILILLFNFLEDWLILEFRKVKQHNFYFVVK